MAKVKNLPPISLGSFIKTRAQNFNLSPLKENEFMRLTAKMGKQEKLLSSDIATAIIHYLGLQMSQELAALTELVDSWRNLGSKTYFDLPIFTQALR